jgi:hypothetical protein
MKRWARTMFEAHNAEQRERARLPWPEKLRISARMREDLRPFKKMREEWHKKRHGEDDAPPAGDPPTKVEQ